MLTDEKVFAHRFISIEEQIREEHRVAMCWRVSGAHRGELLGIQADRTA